MTEANDKNIYSTCMHPLHNLKTYSHYRHKLHSFYCPVVMPRAMQLDSFRYYRYDIVKFMILGIITQ